MLSSLKLSTKLILGYMVVSLVGLVIGLLGMRGSSRINDMLNSMYDNNLVPISDVANANMQAIYHNRAVYDYVLESKKEEMDKIKIQMDSYEKKMDELLAKYRKTDLTEKEKTALEKFDHLWPVYKEQVVKTLPLSYAGDNENASKLLNKEVTDTFQPVDDVLSEIVDINMALGKKAYDESDVVYADVRNSAIAAIVFGFIMSFAIGFGVSRVLSKALRAIAIQLQSAGEQVGAASSQLSAASQQVSAGSTEAASSLEETVASVEELSSMVTANATNAKQAASLAQQSAHSASQGDAGMKKLGTSINEISASAKKIEDIITVIDDISFQINLLALNAAVEAARAGEQGKGFAVVAEGVRSLAQKSAEAAKDIAGLINESVEKTKNGNDLAIETGSSLKEIVESIQKATSINQEIATASEEQAAGISQISKAMQALDASTQQNASASEEVAASAEEMSQQAVTLQEMVAELLSVIDGKNEASSQSIPFAPERKSNSKKSRVHQQAA